MSTKSRLISGRVPVTTAANVASDRYQYLDLSSAEPNLGTGNTGDVLVYDSSYAGGRRWIPQGDIRGSVGESAYVQANTASANTLYLSGVDIWQNTQITNISSLAQGAFAKANSGARATASNTAPTSNTVGDLWLSLTDETLYMYSYDGTSNNWVDISGPILRSTDIVVQYTITANVS